MPKPPNKPQAIDPDYAPEILCNGMFYLTWSGNLGTLTFTHPRPKVGPLFESDTIQDDLVVRARIVMSIDQMRALRDFLSEKIKASGDVIPSGGASDTTRH